MNTSIDEYVQIDKRIAEAEGQAIDSLRDSLRDRWEFGRLMLAERKGKQLPKGKLDELCQATGRSRTELKYRAIFAERYPAESEVVNALTTLKSWRDVIASLPKPPKPGRKPRKPSPSKDPELIKSIVADIDHGDDVSELALTARYGVTERVAIDARNFARGVIDGRAGGEEPVIDWKSLPLTAQKKADVMRRQIRRELESEFEARVWAEVKTRAAAAQQMANEAYADARRVLDARRGIITRDDYDLIRSCLHPDSRLSVTDAKLAKAFRVFNEAEILFLDEAARPTSRLPSSVDGLKRR